MTQLLVSVRNCQEARQAREGGADIIDVKEPAAGSLGACDPPVWRAVVDVCGGGCPISVAWGELRDPWREVAAHEFAGLQFVKLGLSGCRDWKSWQQAWTQRMKRVPATVGRVAVAYADAHLCAAPPLEVVLEFALQFDCCAYLVDTYQKDGRDVFAHENSAWLRTLFAEARRRQLLTVLAGSLSLQSLPCAVACNVDVIAVRGAACRGGRQGEVEGSRVRLLREQLSAPRIASS